MPAVGPGQKIAPGIAGGQFPQYGVHDSSGKYTVAEAQNDSEKSALLAKGYLVWFDSKSAAESYISSQSGIFNGSLPSPLSGLDQIAAIITAAFGALTDITFWRSIGWILLGIVCLFFGLKMWLSSMGVNFPKLPTVIPV